MDGERIRSEDLAQPYMATLRKQNPEQYANYVKLGNGDPLLGYDVETSLLEYYTRVISYLYYYIIEDKKMTMLGISRELHEYNKKIFAGKRSAAGFISRTANIYTMIASNSVQKAETVVSFMKEKHNIDIEQMSV